MSISKYNPLAESSYIKLPNELDHPRKILINIQNTDDNESFKWCLVIYLNTADDHHSARITKADKEFAKRLDKDKNLSGKTRDIQKIEKGILLH